MFDLENNQSPYDQSFSGNVQTDSGLKMEEKLDELLHHPVKGIKFPPGISNSPRHVSERKAWVRTYVEISQLNGWSDKASALSKYQKDWCQKQRNLNKRNILTPWKKDLLKNADFQFSRQKSTASNMEHAVALVQFFKKHGHYAPTITFGGAALTFWLTKMRHSNGTIGIASETSESAAQALHYIKEKIDGFDLKKTVKAKQNIEQGLSHNGYEHTPKEKFVELSPDELHGYGEIQERIRAAICYPMEISNIESNGVLRDVCIRACFYEQAIKATDLNTDCEESWWVKGIKNNQMTMSRGLVDQNGNDHKSEESIVSISKVVDIGYMKSLWLYGCEVVDKMGRTFLLTYDVCLADQSHRYAHPLNFSDYEQSLEERKGKVMNWEFWEEGMPGGKRFIGRNATTNVHFEKNLTLLEDHLKIDREQHDYGYRSNLSYSKSGFIYKIVEHDKLRVRNNDIPPSQVERMAQLDFTWGQEFTHITEILKVSASWLYKDGIKKIEFIGGNGKNPFITLKSIILSVVKSKVPITVSCYGHMPFHIGSCDFNENYFWLYSDELDEFDNSEYGFCFEKQWASKLVTAFMSGDNNTLIETIMEDEICISTSSNVVMIG